MAEHVSKIEGPGLPVYTIEGDGRSSDPKAPAGAKVTYGKLLYKGAGCNCLITAVTPEGTQKLGPLKFTKLANNSSSRPKAVIFFCATGQSVADFEKMHTIEEKKEKKPRGGKGEDEAPRVVPEGWPEDGEYTCEEDEKCADIAQKFQVNLERLIQMNRTRYKGLSKTARLKAGTMIRLPLPGEMPVVEPVAAKKGAKRPQEAGEETQPAKKKAAADSKRKEAQNSEPDEDEPVEKILERAKDTDTPKVIGHRQVTITDRLPFNAVRDSDEGVWETYRKASLGAQKYQDLGQQVLFVFPVLLCFKCIYVCM
jgi:hypothetical protein